MRKRVALLGIYHESNTFIGTPTTLDDFRNSHWFSGEAIRREYAGAYHEIGGMLDVLDASADVELIPVMYAEATPGGTITAEAYQHLLNQMMSEFDAIGPVDGCMVVPHGAAVSASQLDMDGHWLALLRQEVGPQVPIIGTLDPHANVSQAMTDATNALIAYNTNPHIDQRETGQRAGRLMLQTLRNEVTPVQQLVRLPMAISIEQQYTAQNPCKELYALAEHYRQQPGVLSVSVLLGFPYADTPDMGSAFIVVTDEDPDLAAIIGRDLAAYILGRKDLFNGLKNDFMTVLPQLKKAAKPILLLDMGDNIGGGSPGNSTVLLEALEAHTHYRGFIYLHDADAVQMAWQQPLKTPFTLTVGTHPVTGKGYTTSVVVDQKLDGYFSETTPRHGGQTHYNMGPTVVVRTEKETTIMLSTRRIPPFSLRQLTAFGIDPASFDVLIAKGVNAPIAAYGPVCPTIIQVDTPGVTQADMTLFTYRHRQRPMFPFEP